MSYIFLKTILVILPVREETEKATGQTREEVLVSSGSNLMHQKSTWG